VVNWDKSVVVLCYDDFSECYIATQKLPKMLQSIAFEKV